MRANEPTGVNLPLPPLSSLPTSEPDPGENEPWLQLQIPGTWLSVTQMFVDQIK